VTTVTRAKGPSGLFSFKIEWREQDCETLLECLDIDQHTEPERAQMAIAAIEHDLNACLNWMQRGADAPLPAHIVAALRPIAAQAEQLARLVDPARLPVAVLSALGQTALDNGQLCLALHELALSAQLAITRLNGRNSKGVHVQRAGEQLEAVQGVLEALYLRLRPEPEALVDQVTEREYQDSKQEFMQICRGYLPRMPTARTR
jgi:hypothetical protein